RDCATADDRNLTADRRRLIEIVGENARTERIDIGVCRRRNGDISRTVIVGTDSVSEAQLRACVRGDRSRVVVYGNVADAVVVRPNAAASGCINESRAVDQYISIDR